MKISQKRTNNNNNNSDNNFTILIDLRIKIKEIKNRQILVPCKKTKKKNVEHEGEVIPIGSCCAWNGP